MKYLYESHVGSLFTTNEMIDYDNLYCEACGDSDTYIGSFETIADFWNLIKDACDIDGSGGWNLQYVYPYIISEFDLPDHAKYENDYDRNCGFCCNTDEEILCRIKEWIKENNK